MHKMWMFFYLLPYFAIDIFSFITTSFELQYDHVFIYYGLFYKQNSTHDIIERVDVLQYNNTKFHFVFDPYHPFHSLIAICLMH